MRLVVVSNRLPITGVEKEGGFHFQKSSGGLVSGLGAYLNTLGGYSDFGQADYIWVGWPGLTVAPEKQEAVREKILKEFNAWPVFLSRQEMENFYLGFCNRTLWPLFHYFVSYTEFRERFWVEYQEVNRKFCDALLGILKPDDVVWVHDYQLMLLPRMLREARPDLKIGFFLHTPFPVYEIFRLLPTPWCAGLLEGVLGADLAGFHTQDYTQHFLRCVARVLGAENHLDKILLGDRLVKADTYPIGIDFLRFFRGSEDSVVVRKKEKFDTIFRGRKSVFSVDRLDYTKGIINRLEAYEYFLEKYPEWRGKTVFVLVVVPSRVQVPQYQEMKRQIDEKVGHINGRFSHLNWSPILYQHKSISFESLVARYSSSDVALITPLRDGMNLVAKEYVASRRDKSGVLILSEMTGAAKELVEALIVNPNDVGEMAAALDTALRMPPEEQSRRMQVMQSHLRRYDCVQWAVHFLYDLHRVKKEQERLAARKMTPEKQAGLLRDFAASRSRILFLDYDGTLVSFSDDLRKTRPSEHLLDILGKLAAIRETDVVLISGRDKATLEEWFGDLGIAMVAEHGGWLRDRDRRWLQPIPLEEGWKPVLHPILQVYADRLPGSFVEEKDFSLVWHYRKSDPERGSALAKELTDDLVQFTANFDVQILPGSKIVEVRSAGVNKGQAALHFLQLKPYDFVLAAGDDTTDEDLFRRLPPESHTLKVGAGQSAAGWNVANPAAVLALLGRITEAA